MTHVVRDLRWVKEKMDWDDARREVKLEVKFEIAKNALDNNLPIETISKITGLSLNTISDLKTG